MTDEVAAARIEGEGDAAGAQGRLKQQVVVAGGVEVTGVAHGGLGGNFDVLGRYGWVLEALGVVVVAVAVAGEVIPHRELPDDRAQPARLDGAQRAVEVLEAGAGAAGQFLPDQAVDLAIVALVEEVREDRSAVDVEVGAEAAARVERAVRHTEEAGQVLQVVVDFRVGDFLHPGRGRFLPPDPVVALVVAELDGVVEFVGDGHAQCVVAAGLLIDGIGEVVVELQVAVGGVAALLGIGVAIGGSAAEIAEVDVVFVAVQTVVRGRRVVAEPVDFEHPGAVEDGRGQFDIVGDSVAVRILGGHGFGAGGVVVQ